VDLPRTFVIAESGHRIHNPIDSRKLADFGRALRLAPGTTMLDLASGSGEMLCTWARDHRVRGTGVDISTAFLAKANARAEELGVAGRVAFVHGDAAGHVAAEPVDVAACIGATWIGGGTAGTVELLQRSLKPGGLMLIGECYWRLAPPDEATVKACHVASEDDLFDLPGLADHFGGLGYDVVEMMLADQDSWDRYRAAQWLNVRDWLDANPGHELYAELRAELDAAPLAYVSHERPYLGWGVFALRRRLGFSPIPDPSA
jgi:SAM-dependent methyltransferase